MRPRTTAASPPVQERLSFCLDLPRYRDWLHQHLMEIQLIASIEVIGFIARLTYRPQTRVTAAWYANVQETTAEYLDLYAKVRLAASAAA
jgi:hypothetical protein